MNLKNGKDEQTVELSPEKEHLDARMSAEEANLAVVLDKFE